MRLMRPTPLGSWTFESAHGDGGGGGGEGARDNVTWVIRSRCSGQLLSPLGVVGAVGRGAALCVLCCRRPGFLVSTVVWPRGGASSKPEAETLLELLPEQLGEPPPGLPPLLLEVLCKLLREPGCASWLQPLPQPQPLPLRWTWHAMGVCRPA